MSEHLFYKYFVRLLDINVYVYKIYTYGIKFLWFSVYNIFLILNLLFKVTEYLLSLTNFGRTVFTLDLCRYTFYIFFSNSFATFECYHPYYHVINLCNLLCTFIFTVSCYQIIIFFKTHKPIPMRINPNLLTRLKIQ